GERAHALVANGVVERRDVLRRRRLGETLTRRWPVEARLQRIDRVVVEVAVPPLDRLYQVEAMRFERLDQCVLERVDAAGHAEGTVAHVPSGPACDLPEFGGGQPAVLIAVELSVGGEGNMVDVEIEAHADRVGGDQE